MKKKTRRTLFFILLLWLYGTPALGQALQQALFLPKTVVCNNLEVANALFGLYRSNVEGGESVLRSLSPDVEIIGPYCVRRNLFGVPMILIRKDDVVHNGLMVRRYLYVARDTIFGKAVYAITEIILSTRLAQSSAPRGVFY